MSRHFSAEVRHRMSEAQKARHAKVRARLVRLHAPAPAGDIALSQEPRLAVEARLVVHFNGQSLDMTLDEARALQQALSAQLTGARG